MTIVVKIGGAAIEDAATLRKCARSIAELAQDGHRVAVVHGGGSALTRMLNRLGKKSEFVDGLRITDAETRDTALMVLGGIINKKLVAGGGDSISRHAGYRILRRRWHDVPRTEEVCAWARFGICGRDLFCGTVLDRSAMAAGRDPGAGFARAGRRRRILQRERG